MNNRRECTVLFFNTVVGEIKESEEGYSFRYFEDYLSDINAKPISVTLPLRAEPFKSKMLHPFFDGLIPEGWTLDIITKNSIPETVWACSWRAAEAPSVQFLLLPERHDGALPVLL